MQPTEDTLLFHDLGSKILMNLGLSGDPNVSPRDIALVRKAISDAYRDLPSKHKWKWYRRRFVLYSEPSVALGITYDATGGAHERLCTITSGSAPTNLTSGAISRSFELFQIDTQISSTQFTLKAETDPKDDFSEEVLWVRQSYQVPVVIRNIDEVWSRTRRLSYMDEGQTAGYSKFAGKTGLPTHYSFRSSPQRSGQFEILFSPAPQVQEPFEFQVSSGTRELKTYDVFEIDGSATGSIFTSASGKFRPEMAGCVLRICTFPNVPKHPNTFDETRADFTHQFYIKSVTNSTTLVVDGTLPTGSSFGWQVSDVIDIYLPTMLSALEAMTMEKHAQSSRSTESILLDISRANAKKELIRALEADSMVNWSFEAPTNGSWMFDGSINAEFDLHIHE